MAPSTRERIERLISALARVQDIAGRIVQAEWDRDEERAERLRAKLPLAGRRLANAFADAFPSPRAGEVARRVRKTV
jgi:hypothetical protein